MIFRDKIFGNKSFKLIIWFLLTALIITGLYASQKITQAVIADEKGPFVIYLDVQNAKEFEENGVGVYAYNSASEKDSSVPMEMRPSDMGKGIYEYTFDRKWKYVAFTGGYGSWDYELATLPVNIEWEYNTPCFVLAKPEGTNTRGVWRNLSSTLYFDASLIKDKKVFVENGVYVCAYEEIENSDGLVTVQPPVKMQKSEKGEDIYEYTLDRPYSIVRFILGATTDAEPASELVHIDWAGYASPCYRMSLPASYDDLKPEETSTEESSIEESSTEENSTEESSTEESSVEESSTEESSAEESLTEESSVEESATEESSAEKSSTEESSAEESSVDESSIEESSVEESSVEGSTVEESSAEESSAKLPTPESSTAEQPSTESSSTVESEKETTAAEPASAETPAQPESSGDKPTTEEHPETAEGAMSEESEEDKKTAKNVTRRVKSAFTEREQQTAYSMTESQAQAEGSTQSEPEPASENGTESTSEYASESSSTSEPQPASEDSSQSEPESNLGDNAESEPESASENSSESTSESASETESEGESNSDTGTSPDGELYDIDADTLVYATLADVPMLLSDMTTVQKIYFDTEGNGGWNDWTINVKMYIYLIGPNEYHEMSISNRKNTLSPSSTGILWEYSLTDSDKENCSAFIFTTQSPISDKTHQTVNISVLGLGSHPCYKLDGGNEGSKKTAYCYGDLGPETMKGKIMYFYDVADKVADVSAVSATFSISTATGTSPNVSVPLDSGKGGYVIPNDAEIDSNDVPYDTVQFKDKNGGNLGEAWNFIDYAGTMTSGFLFEQGTKDTYYYAATEKADGTIISSWGKQPGTGTGSLSGKTLYFDKLHFPTKKGSTTKTGKLQIGDGEPIVLGTPMDDSSTFCYTFPDDTAATQQTPLTFIDDADTKYHFRWTDFGTSPDDINMVTLSNSIASVAKTYSKAVTVYFDATYSKLQYYDAANSGDYSIPKASDGTIRYYATGDGKTDITDLMTLVESYSVDGHTWNDVYKVDLPEGYSQIAFSNFTMSSITNYGGHGESTTKLSIPTDIANPCFYADTSDASVYDGGTRSGYWDEVYTIRDAEKKKTDKDIVDIASGTFTRESSVLYVNTTFYDYYTDYELNGSNRDNYGGTNAVSQRTWVTFRQFDQALSDYYKQNNVDIPIYTGHFQPPVSGWDYQFNAIAPTLDLYGHGDTNKFYSTNNSTYDYTNGFGTSNAYVYCAAQGLVSSSLNANGELLMTTDTGTVLEPHFDENFLLGNNSKNAVLGDVYHNVAFPFVQKDVNSNGVKYWYFDSAETTLAMKQDTATDTYYLKDVGNQAWSKNVNSSSVTSGVSNTYGFFPFNETSAATSAKNYNYGFGAKLEFTFRLTENGTVKDNSDADVPITFEFAGDDDVWVFIDGNLVLDVGGSHGKVSGKIDFQAKKATVSKVKTSAGSTGSTSKDFTLNGSNTAEHTLAMYYMERGMWESNMHISFNFPDENKLEVEKQVDKTDVNPIFRDLFDNKSLFTYHIKTQATHYGTKDVTSSGTTVSPITFNDDFPSSTLSTTASDNTFEWIDGIDGQSNVAHWYAKLEDKTGAYRNLRYGALTSESGATVNIDGMSYLEFKFYYDYKDTPSLSNMYLQLVDSNGKIKGNTTDYLSGKTYGIPSMAGKKWVTVKIRLDTLVAEEGFNNLIKEIRFGYNYPRDIYLDDFIFKPATVAGELTGFVVKQYNIPDYGSATSGQLEIPDGAVYSSTTGINGTIDEEGIFVLQNKEVITFTNQIRRGSYIYLEEESNPLFDTTYTMYENGQAVSSFGTGGTVVQNGSVSSLTNVSGTVVNDDRTEQVITGQTDYQDIQNSYTTAQQPTDHETFVYRSYAYPDDETMTTKLRVVYTNKVKTGSLKIQKKQLYVADTLTGTYTIKVTFTNVGGIALENEPIVVTIPLKVGEEYDITGIPIGTFYTIEEITPTDGSYLGKVEVSNADNMTVHTDTWTVEAHIASDSTPDTATIYNTNEPKISVGMEKNWQDEVSGTELSQDKLPSSILVQLQRKKSSDDDTMYGVVLDGDGNPVYQCIELTPIYEMDAGGNIKPVWKYSISGLDKVVDYENNDLTDWVYRFVEVTKEIDADDNVIYHVVEDGNIITLTNTSGTSGDFEVTNGTPEQDAMTSDYANTITNTLLGPVNLQVKKTSMQDSTAIKDVRFVLEKKNGDIFSSIGDATTGENGIATFADLENGTYRLTEMKTAGGFTLLKESMIIVIDRTTGTFTYRMEKSESESEAHALTWTSSTRTISIEIKNAQNIVLPATGWNGFWESLAIIGVMVLMVVIMLMNDQRKRRRRRLRQKRRREGIPPGR